MQTFILDKIPFTVDRAAVRRVLGLPTGLQGDASGPDGIEELAAAAENVARPKAAWRDSYIDNRSGDETVVDGVTFASRVLRVNLDPVHRVFPHVVTCGTEIERWSESISDPLERFAADVIKEHAVGAALAFLESHLRATSGFPAFSHMNPGSLPDWPLPQQEPLFRLLGDLDTLIGVRLTESFLMLPTKTVSGIFFPTETSFQSCQLCPREVCRGRRAPYDPALYQERFARAAGHD
jgi:hypothetical protein